MLSGVWNTLASLYGVYSVLVTILCFVLGLFISTFYKYQVEKAALKGIPKPAGHWLYGNFHQIPFGRGISQFMQWTNEHGPLFIVKIGPFIHQVMLNGPEEAKALLATSEPKDPYVYRMLIPWIGDGLLVSKGQKWARNRRLLTPAFHFDILKPYQKLFSESTMTMVMKWKRLLKEKPNQPIEMFDHVSQMTLDSLMKCIFGLDKGSQGSYGAPYIKAVYALTHLLWKRFHFLPYHSDLLYYLSYSGYKFRQMCKVAHQFTRSVIQMKREEKSTSHGTEQAGKRYVDFIDMLLDCKDDNGQGLEDKEIQDEVDTFMFEGHDTTASAVAWCLYNLAENHNCQAKCREEVMSVIGKRDNVSWDDLSKLPYLTMCVKESLRTHPPIPAVGRLLTKPLTLSSGHTLPAGTWCVSAIFAVNSNPEVWSDPDKYMPERFSLENSSSRHTHAFIPFSAGPRNCIGQHFAMNEVKTAIALVLKKFMLRVDTERPPESMVKIVLRSTNGVWLYMDSV